MKIIEIPFETKKQIQLEMLQEIDAFCRANHIRYSLAFGTLLGAIRHNGFIPWDDDVDIMMPLPDMIRFKNTFHSNTIKYYDVDTYNHFAHAFSRLVDTRTYNKCGIIYKGYGVCIDLYPVVSIPYETDFRYNYFDYAFKLQKKADFLRKWRARCLRYLPITRVPLFDILFDNSIKQLNNYFLYFEDYGSTNMYFIVAGPVSIHDKMTFDFDIFEEITDVNFEGYQFMSIKEYDIYLNKRYGNYMELPPIEERHPTHGGHFFWKQMHETSK